MEMVEAASSRAGFVALIGEPNAGKSTLLNRMVGQKLAIVTHKVQTTRAPLRGIAISEASQIVFIDTPGLFAPRRRLDRAMVGAAWRGASEADIVLMLVEAHRGLTDRLRTILKQLQETVPSEKIVLVINKIDRVAAEALLPLVEELNLALPFAKTFMISAERGHGCEDLKSWLAEKMPESPWLYPEDQIADMPLRMIAAEITREKLMLRLHEELPYQITVETEEWETRKDGSIRIQQVIYVARPGHRGIVLGHKGETIKAISQAARADISELTGSKTHLFLEARLKPNWQEDADRYTNIGLDWRDGG